jgi:hypothetical protein
MTAAETIIITRAVSKAIRAVDGGPSDDYVVLTPAGRKAGELAYAEALARVLADRTPPTPPEPGAEAVALESGYASVVPGQFDLVNADAYGMATLGLAPICGGSPEAERVVIFTTAHDGRAWIVSREGKPVFKSKSLTPARMEMSRRAKGEATSDDVMVRITTRFQDGTTASTLYAPGGEMVPPVAGGSPCKRADAPFYGGRILPREPRGPWDLESHEIATAGSQLGHRS